MVAYRKAAALPSAASSACSIGLVSREYPRASSRPSVPTMTAPTAYAVSTTGHDRDSSIAASSQRRSGSGRPVIPCRTGR